MQRPERPGYPIWKYFSEEDRSKWWLAFEAENCPYPEELVELLATVYFASGKASEGESEWWRVTKLGVKERVHAALAAPTSTSPLTQGDPVEKAGYGFGPRGHGLAPGACTDAAGATHTSPLHGSVASTENFTNPVLTMEDSDPNIIAYASEAEERRRKILEAAQRRQEQEKARGLRAVCIASVSLH
jgi:hypothetical protein